MRKFELEQIFNCAGTGFQLMNHLVQLMIHLIGGAFCSISLKFTFHLISSLSLQFYFIWYYFILPYNSSLSHVHSYFVLSPVFDVQLLKHEWRHQVNGIVGFGVGFLVVFFFFISLRNHKEKRNISNILLLELFSKDYAAFMSSWHLHAHQSDFYFHVTF